MGTLVNSQSITQPTFEEFLGYDQKGQSVILRRSTNHPGNPVPTPAFESASEQPQAKASTGSLRFFADFHEVKARLAKRAAG